MNEIVLRDYQLQSIEQLRQGIREGMRSQILCAPTGAGKTVMAAHLMHEASRKGAKVAFVVDRIALCDQTSATLDYYGIPHGVVQAGHWRTRPYEHVQVCSAQTLEKRGFFPRLDLLIADEAHCVRRQTAEFIKSRQDVRVLGLTATPFTKGLGELYDNLVNVTTTNKLIAEGHLVPMKIYAAKAIDMTGAKIVAGEWSEKEIEERGKCIIGDIVAEWQAKTTQHFGGPVKTIVFSATVAHGEELCRQFSAAGFRFEQISYKDTNDAARRDLIAEFRKPDSDVIGLVSCEVLTKGFDVPDVLCGIAARPYRKSFSSHIQQLGRVMRPYPGKTFGLWLDHCGNALRFRADTDDFWEHGIAALNSGELDAKARKEPDETEKEQYACSCGYMLPPGCQVCPSCGKEHRRQSLIQALPGTMVELGSTSTAPLWMQDRSKIWAQLCWMGMKRKGHPELAERFAKAQYHNLFGSFPRYGINSVQHEPPCHELEQRVRYFLIRWAKSQEKKRRAA